MTDGQLLIASWKRICVALDCSSKKTAKKKLKTLGVKIRTINGTAHVSVAELTKKL